MKGKLKMPVHVRRARFIHSFIAISAVLIVPGFLQVRLKMMMMMTFFAHRVLRVFYAVFFLKYCEDTAVTVSKNMVHYSLQMLCCHLWPNYYTRQQWDPISWF
jgi:hypothetical protein